MRGGDNGNIPDRTHGDGEGVKLLGGQIGEESRRLGSFQLRGRFLQYVVGGDSIIWDFGEGGSDIGGKRGLKLEVVVVLVEVVLVVESVVGHEEKRGGRDRWGGGC
jgi:hypothetical protein